MPERSGVVKQNNYGARLFGLAFFMPKKFFSGNF